MRPHGKLLYGLLQTMPGFQNGNVSATSGTVCRAARVAPATAKVAVRELTATGWLEVQQASRLAPLCLTLRTPGFQLPPMPRSAPAKPSRFRLGVTQAKLRLEEQEYSHEAIMKEFLTLLIDSDDYEDNARPGFLTNPLTDELMELDRYYPPVLAVEFHGPQHFQTTEKFPSESALAMLQARDLMKEALCARVGIRLVVIQQADLSLETMRQKVGDLLPLRDLKAHRRLANFMKQVGRAYR